MITGQDVADFLGQGDNPELVTLAGNHALIVTEMARAYTRGNGFDGFAQPTEPIEAVITTATARLIANPEQIESTIGGVTMRGGFTGWSLAETFVLNRYRKRAS